MRDSEVYGLSCGLEVAPIPGPSKSERANSLVGLRPLYPIFRRFGSATRITTLQPRFHSAPRACARVSGLFRYPYRRKESFVASGKLVAKPSPGSILSLLLEDLSSVEKNDSTQDQ